MKKRCEVCGMYVEEAPRLTREFEGETYYFCTGLCMISFEIRLEKIIAERERFFEESRRSLGLSRFLGTSQLNEAVMAERKRVLGKAHCTVCPSSSETQLNSGGHHDHA